MGLTVQKKYDFIIVTIIVIIRQHVYARYLI
jgi:hypothetical protein